MIFKGNLFETMKLTIGLFAVMLIITSSFALPAGHPNDDAEIINTSNISENSSQDDIDTNFKNFQGVVDTGVGDPYYSYTLNPFSFFDYFQDTLRRIRDGIERKIWAQAGLDTDEDGLALKDSKPNSTSVVEVIDGHKIEINETVYENNKDDGHAIFKVRVIQIRPLDLDENFTTEGTNIANESNLKADQDLEDTDDLSQPSADNEINRSIISTESFKLHDNPPELEMIYTTTLPNLNASENDGIKKIKVEKHLDMKNYELLNETNFYTIIETTEKNQEENQATLIQDGDFEESSTTTTQIITTQTIRSEYTRESLESESSEEEKNEYLNNEWGTLEDNSISKEIYSDLSNDIFINQLLADQGVTYNPEAEIFSDVEINSNSNNSNTSNANILDESVVPAQTNFSSTNIK